MDDLEKKDRLLKKLVAVIDKSLDRKQCKLGHCLCALSEILCFLSVVSNISDELFSSMMESGYIKALEEKKEVENENSKHGT